MIRHEFEQALVRTAMMPARILWVGMLGTPVILAGVLAYRIDPQTAEPLLTGSTVETVLYVAAGLLSIVYFAVRSSLLRPEVLARTPPPTGPEDPSVQQVSQNLPEPESAEERAALGAAGGFMIRNIITWAIADAVGVIGFAGGILTAKTGTSYLIIGASLLLILLGPPSRDLLAQTITYLRMHPPMHEGTTD